MYELFFEHLLIVLISGIFILLLGLVLAICAYLYPKTQKIILNTVDLFQTIPTLAMLGIVMVFFGPNKFTAITALVLYSLLPVVRSTLNGFNNIADAVHESAIAMGMTKSQKLFYIDLPLAIPYIFSGLKIALISAIGSAVFASLVGGGGLGVILHKGVRTQNMKMIRQGTIALIIMSIFIEKSIDYLEKSISKEHQHDS